MTHRLTVPLALVRQTHVEPSPHVMSVAAMFGLGLDASRSVTIVPPTPLELRGGEVVFVTGSSGSGKSSILRLIHEHLAPSPDARVIDFRLLPDPPERPLVDAMGDRPLEAVLRVFALAGLNDAFVMLRKPAELSDGQRYRLRLAAVMLAVEDEPGDRLTVVLADEFGAALDRVTARVIARNVRKWVSRQPRACFIAATTHDDLLEPLEPDVLIEKHLGEGMEVLRRDAH